MPNVSDEINAPIEIYADDSVIDGGIAAIPKMLLRFAKHLKSDVSHLNDRQVLLLVMVIALREDRTLRLSNLPMIAAVSTLESDLACLRKMGLVFTTRDYYPARRGKPPRMRSQLWDIRSLIANLAQIQGLWFQRQADLVNDWRAQGQPGHRPIYEFPNEFEHTVTIPRPVLENIVAGRFFPVPDTWQRYAKGSFSPEEFLALQTHSTPTASKTGGRGNVDAPTSPDTAGRPNSGVPTTRNTGGHLLTSSTSEQDLSVSDESVFAHFAKRKGQSYTPTGNDRKDLMALSVAGYTNTQIMAVIDEVFERGDCPKRLTYCTRILRDRPPARPPIMPTEASQSPAAETTLPPELEALVQLCASDKLPLARQRVKIMRDSCEAAAQLHNTTGTQWVKDVLERSLGKDDPLTYAAAIVRSWIQHGPQPDARDQRSSQTPTQRLQSNPQHPTQSWTDSIDT